MVEKSRIEGLEKDLAWSRRTMETRGLISNLQAKSLSAAEREKFLKSLNFPERDSRLNDIKEACHRTFEWLFGDISNDVYLKNDSLEHSQDILQDQSRDLLYESLVAQCQGKAWSCFTSWLKSNEDLYWITGKPGSGKSTLMKFLYDDPSTRRLLNENTPGETIMLSHFFYIMGSPMQCNIKRLLCDLLYQLFRRDTE